jgi:CrcB protein
MKMFLAVALGGALGASGRYFVAQQALRLLGPNFPWGTLMVNIVGSLVMGLLVELMALKISVVPEVRVFLITGLLGGFTTFSAFSLEVAVMVERHAHGLALSYVLLSVLFSVGGLFLGLWLVRTVVT